MVKTYSRIARWDPFRNLRVGEISGRDHHRDITLGELLDEFLIRLELIQTPESPRSRVSSAHVTVYKFERLHKLPRAF
jgi:hypothetical protein